MENNVSEKRTPTSKEIDVIRAWMQTQWERIPATPHSQPGSYARGYDGGMVDILRGLQATLDKLPPAHETLSVDPFPYPTDRDGWICSVCHGWNVPKDKACMRACLDGTGNTQKAPAETKAVVSFGGQNFVPGNVMYSPCERHKQGTFTMTVGYTPMPTVICPGCESEANAQKASEQRGESRAEFERDRGFVRRCPKCNRDVSSGCNYCACPYPQSPAVSENEVQK